MRKLRSLIYDPIQVDWYQERQLKLNQRREEENVEHYNVTDYMTIPEDYKEE